VDFAVIAAGNKKQLSPPKGFSSIFWQARTGNLCRKFPITEDEIAPGTFFVYLRHRHSNFRLLSKFFYPQIEKDCIDVLNLEAIAHTKKGSSLPQIHAWFACKSF
jgi:hypothetical protein